MFPPAPLRLPVSKELHEGNALLAYLRNSSVIIDELRYHALVIARVDVAPVAQKKGYFRELCTFLEGFATRHPFIQVVQHECVINPDVAEMLLKHGYAAVPPAEGMPTEHYFRWAKQSPVPIGPDTTHRDRSLKAEIPVRRR